MWLPHFVIFWLHPYEYCVRSETVAKPKTYCGMITCDIIFALIQSFLPLWLHTHSTSSWCQDCTRVPLPQCNQLICNILRSFREFSFISFGTRHHPPASTIWHVAPGMPNHVRVVVNKTLVTILPILFFAYIHSVFLEIGLYWAAFAKMWFCCSGKWCLWLSVQGALAL